MPGEDPREGREARCQDRGPAKTGNPQDRAPSETNRRETTSPVPPPAAPADVGGKARRRTRHYSEPALAVGYSVSQGECGADRAKGGLYPCGCRAGRGGSPRAFGKDKTLYLRGVWLQKVLNGKTTEGVKSPEQMARPALPS